MESYNTGALGHFKWELLTDDQREQVSHALDGHPDDRAEEIVRTAYSIAAINSQYHGADCQWDKWIKYIKDCASVYE